MNYEKYTNLLNSIKNFLKLIKKHYPKIVLLIIIITIGGYSLFITKKNDELEKIRIQLNDTINGNYQDINRLKNNLDSLQIEYDSLIDEYDNVLELDKYLESIALRESSGDQWSVNRYGMLGLYQFNPKTLNYLGINEEKYNYLNNISIQNYAMITYLKYNKKKLNKYIDEYNGKTFKGIYITTSGILAGAHLTGAGGVMEFFDNSGKYKQKDANDIHVSEYIAQFSGYDVSLIN